MWLEWVSFYCWPLLLALYLLRRWHHDKQIVENLMEKYVFITGCDSGFGNLAARQLDARGLRVLAACLTEEGAANLTAATSGRLQTTLLDVSSTESVAKATEWVKGLVGDKGLWGVVNNAGIALPAGPNEWLTKEDFRKVLDINLLGVIDVTIHMLPLLRKAKGRVVNVSSIMGRISYFGGGYCPSKYAVEAFSDSLRLEMHCFGVKVCIVEPGYFQTTITNVKTMSASITDCWERLPEETRQAYGESYLRIFLRGINIMKRSCSNNLSLVTNCMEHALTAVHPHTRYSAGWDAKLLLLPLSYGPTWLRDTLVAQFYPKPTWKN